jgi:hypothetical protein
MNYNVGDKISLLNETGNGIVTKLINKTTVLVLLENGFEIPFQTNQLVAVYDSSKEIKTQSSESSIVLSQPKVTVLEDRTKSFAPSVYLAYTMENDTDFANSAFNLWLINHTFYQLYYTFALFENKKMKVIENGELNAKSQLLLATANKNEIEKYATVQLDGLFFKTENYDYKPVFSKTIKIKKTKFFNESYFIINDIMEQRCLLIDILENSESSESTNNTIDLKALPYEFEKKRQQLVQRKQSIPHQKNDVNLEMEIDLHIHELTEQNYKLMSNAEIIDIQLKHFKLAIDKAIAGNYQKLIVIHGVGKGKLKHEVCNILKANKFTYYDASYAKYGFGATEVKL